MSVCLSVRGGTSYEKVGGQKKIRPRSAPKIFAAAPAIPVCPHPSVVEPGAKGPPMKRLGHHALWVLCPGTALGVPTPEPRYKRKTRQNAPFHTGYSNFFSGEGDQSPVLQLINLIFVTVQHDTIMQSLSDYFNVSKFCIK